MKESRIMPNRSQAIWYRVFLFLGLLLGIFIVYVAHGHESHRTVDSISNTISTTYPSAHNSGSLSDFPTLHPLVVHVPIMFLILAFIVQVISFFAFRQALSWVVLFLVVFGFIGAYFASGIFHGGDPNLVLLDSVTRATFEKHKQYANYTVWISGFAAVAKIISHFFLKRKMIAEVIVAGLLLAASYTVAVAGDMGARLVHIDGIGVQGRGIPAEDDM
ncbi:MAG: hypothetical protein K6T34_03280 [Thermoflavifilum sp.]|nr:hypothetical protein [Thermoflavifilum sp.]